VRDMTKEHEEMQSWSKSVAEIVADEMLRCKLIKEEDFNEGVEVIGEEIFCRLIVGDYPPPPFRWKLLEKKR
jgi:hypothetical protein